MMYRVTRPRLASQNWELDCCEDAAPGSQARSAHHPVASAPQESSHSGGGPSVGVLVASGVRVGDSVGEGVQVGVVVGLAREMRSGHFQDDCRMTKDGMKIASSAFYGRLDERITYREKSQIIRNIIRSQASAVATFLRGERPCYEPFTPRW